MKRPTQLEKRIAAAKRPTRKRRCYYKSDGGWSHEMILIADALRWQHECRRIARDRTDPHPTLADFVKFKNTIK